ncbi:MAG: diaminobutyrate--2-oxoglutarate transaminase [Dehalococcoidia bacterium]|nr:diaminobutyrate--2-oxoglutarate transaminase [Dehalococcoidia bacterium]
MKTFNEVILKPREFDYKIQFPGPTGTNSVEAALKLARKYTGRNLIIGFTNAFHGMTLGSLSVTGNEMKRRGAGVPLHHSVSMPYEDFFGEDVNTIDYLRSYMRANGSGVEAPAAIIVETVQAEGGVHTASMEWLKQLLRAGRTSYGALFIVDDIQAGNGRTGKFFSFEEAGIVPDIVCLSKSLSGIGLPMAIDLIRPELDVWDAGEHNGTFRGYNPAFATSAATLNRYWRDDGLTREVNRKADIVSAFLQELADEFPDARGKPRGRGLLQGFYTPVPGLASDVAAEAFKRQLIIETSGPNSEVVKLLPALTIDDDTCARASR